jgi:isocitrate/isopropylmalate dehydrogenase
VTELLATYLAVLLCGTRALTASVNGSASKFSTYQTIHGTARALKGKNLANPAGMMCALALMLSRSFGWQWEGQVIYSTVCSVVQDALPKGAPMYNGDLILQNYGSREFGNDVIERLRVAIKSAHAA